MGKYRKKELPVLSVTTRQPKLPQVEYAVVSQDPLEQPEEPEPMPVLGLQHISGSKRMKGLIQKNGLLCSVCGKSIAKGKKWFSHWKFSHRTFSKAAMKALETGKSPLQPDWIEAIPNDWFKEKQTLREHLSQGKDNPRVGIEAHYDSQIIKLGEINLDANQELKSKILEDFKAGHRIKRHYRDIAWQVFKEAGIDALNDWEPVEASQK